MQQVRTAAVLAALLLATAALAGCGSEEDPRELQPAARGTTLTPWPGPSGESTAATPAPASSAAATSDAPPASAPPAAEEVRLTGDGVDLPGVLLEFGAPFAAAQKALREVLWPPSADSSRGPSAGAYGVCPGSTVRALEYGDGALVLLFGDAADPELRMFSWSLTDRGTASAVPAARALVGDVTTYDLTVGHRLTDLRTGTTGVELDVQPGDELLPASFRLRDQSSGLYGTLTSAEPDGTVTGVAAGDACGE
ncbi:hypothetical protein BH24ACT10_BH24ACT10_03620 [soil metagenome]